MFMPTLKKVAAGALAAPFLVTSIVIFLGAFLLSTAIFILSIVSILGAVIFGAGVVMMKSISQFLK